MVRWGWAAVAVLGASAPAFAQDRADDNAVTQAEDAFGFSVGRETIGIYNANSARSFSPAAAGNARLDGLYVDLITLPISALSVSSSIKVGLSAQGYPFLAPSGIVDFELNRPGFATAASIIANGDSFGSAGLEIDGSFKLSNDLALGYSVNPLHTEYPDGTSNYAHSEGVTLRWRPAPGVEIVPFWTLENDYDDEAGQFLIPSGAYLPPVERPHTYDGPEWSDIRYTATNHGVVASAAPSATWLVRLVALRSVLDQTHGYANLLYDITPAGDSERITIADPPLKSRSVSGELRVSHSIADGPRLHVLQVSARERDAHHQFDGSAEADLGPLPIGVPEDSPQPAFAFGPVSRDHVQQQTLGVAYDGRWKDVGELSFSVSKAFYRKTTDQPGVPLAITRSRPWLYNGTLAIQPFKALTVYAGYARGLEESGVAAPSAANRNQPLPAILTEQKDAGVRIALTKSLTAVAGVFDLTRPYFGFDAANLYTRIGEVRSRGAEFSVSGAVTKKLDVVLGGVLFDPKVSREPDAAGAIGRKPTGIATHLFSLNADWKTPILEGLSFDVTLLHRGSITATTDNLVTIPPRMRLDLGGRYRFKLRGHDATLRLQAVNLLDQIGVGYAGPGIYTGVPGRYVTGYLAVDI